MIGCFTIDLRYVVIQETGAVCLVGSSTLFSNDTGDVCRVKLLGNDDVSMETGDVCLVKLSGRLVLLKDEETGDVCLVKSSSLALDFWTATASVTGVAVGSIGSTTDIVAVGGLLTALNALYCLLNHSLIPAKELCCSDRVPFTAASKSTV